MPEPETPEPPLYNITKAIRIATRARRRRDPLTVHTVHIADQLATHMARHFTAEQADTAGRALILAAASIGILMQHSDPMGQATTNIVLFAGHRLVLDAQAERDAPVEPQPAKEASRD